MNSEFRGIPRPTFITRIGSSAEVGRFLVVLTLLAGWDQDDVIFSEDAQFLKVNR